MLWWQVILFPFAILYDLSTRFRNHLYNIRQKPSFKFEANVISVGNLAVGGTGKSPMVEYIIRLLRHHNKKISTLSRGYGRKSRGFRIASASDDAQSIGDEPMSFHLNYSPEVMVTVGEERAAAIPQILYEQPDNDCIVLDDAFQHRTVEPSYSILLTTYDHPFFRDFLLPAGSLRESRSGAKRAHVVVVTKCPEHMPAAEEQLFREQIANFAPQKDVYFTRTSYLPLKSIGKKMEKMPKKWVAVAGLASNRPFFQSLKSQTIVKELSYQDHHHYTLKDFQRITQDLDDETGILTTEKDAVKLMALKGIDQFPCYYQPIEIVFLKDENKFQNELLNSLKDYDRDLWLEEEDN